MSEDDPNTDQAPTPKKKKMARVLGKANEARESVTSVADTANNAFGAIKWVAIAICLGLSIFTGVSFYKLVTAPARAVGNAAGAVTDTVKSGASSVKDGTSDIINRNVIAVNDQSKLNRAAEAAFDAISNMGEVPPENMKERLFWKTNFSGHENKVCQFSMSFGGDKIPIFIAADNKDYATSKSLGSKKDRMMRILIRADGDDLALNTEWDHDASVWVMKWKGTTIKKSLDDADAERRVFEVLGSAARECGG